MSAVIEVIEELVPPELHDKACGVCADGSWHFGHGSNATDAASFWKMDLTADPVFDAIWREVRPRCEALAGAPLRVIRQYANGHTFGLGGRPHTDDTRPGSFTLLYYPMTEWKEEWEGETVFHDAGGEIAAIVRPRPNRAVFFDSRIPHAGRAPSRACHALRVTVAYKLETVGGEAPPKVLESVEELEREGARRVYKVHIASDRVDALKALRLEELGKTVRLPGFRPGKIPLNVLEKRYGAKARSEVANRLAAEAADRIFATGGLASAIEAVSGRDSGDIELRIAVTHLPDLAALDFAELAIERLSASPEDVEAAGLTEAAANEIFRDHLGQQVLDYLDSAYPFSIAPALVDREFAAIRQVAESQLGAGAGTELRVIAERRVRLGAVVAELARRFQIAVVEERVVDRLIASARVSDRIISSDELRELAG